MLVDTCADFSIMRQELADHLRKVKTPWAGPHIKSAGGQLMTPTSKCTARLRIRDFSFVVTFVLLSDCFKELISGMDFLKGHGPGMNIPEFMVTFCTHPYVDNSGDEPHGRLRIADDVILPPRSCWLVSVSGGWHSRSFAHARHSLSREASWHLLMDRQMCSSQTSATSAVKP